MFRIGLLQKLFESWKKICFEMILNGSKSNWIPQAWKEICYEIFGGLEVQTTWILLKNELFYPV